LLDGFFSCLYCVIHSQKGAPHALRTFPPHRQTWKQKRSGARHVGQTRSMEGLSELRVQAGHEKDGGTAALRGASPPLRARHSSTTWRTWGTTKQAVLSHAAASLSRSILLPYSPFLLPSPPLMFGERRGQKSVRSSPSSGSAYSPVFPVPDLAQLGQHQRVSLLAGHVGGEPKSCRRGACQDLQRKPAPQSREP